MIDLNTLSKSFSPFSCIGTVVEIKGLHERGFEYTAVTYETLSEDDTDLLMEHKEVFEVGRCCTWSRAVVMLVNMLSRPSPAKREP